MTANTDEHEQLRLIFLEQVGHLITDGTIETRSLKRAGISFACGNLHAAFLVWQETRRAPVVQQGWLPISSAPDDGQKALVYRPLAHKTNDPNITVARLVGGNNSCWKKTVPEGDAAYNPTDRGCHVTHWMPLPAPPLAATPQPPEATVNNSLTVETAPVQLPEPAGWVDDGGMLFWTEDTPPDGENIYTEQQVRQLLASEKAQGFSHMEARPLEGVSTQHNDCSKKGREG